MRRNALKDSMSNMRTTLEAAESRAQELADRLNTSVYYARKAAAATNYATQRKLLERLLSHLNLNTTLPRRYKQEVTEARQQGLEQGRMQGFESGRQQGLVEAATEAREWYLERVDRNSCEVADEVATRILGLSYSELGNNTKDLPRAALVVARAALKRAMKLLDDGE